MRQETFVCDVCGAVKGTTNHWWKVEIESNNTLIMSQWTMMGDRPKVSHICGEACALKKVSEFMGRK